MTTPRALAQTLQRYRIEQGLTQAMLAARAGVSRRWLVEFEQGHDTAQLWKVLSVANALGVDLEPVAKTDR